MIETVIAAEVVCVCVCLHEYLEHQHWYDCVCRAPDTGHTHTDHWCPSSLEWIFNKPQSICSIIHEKGHRMIRKYKHCCFPPALFLFCTSNHLHLSSLTLFFHCRLFWPPSFSFFLSPVVLRLWIFQMTEWFLNYPLLASALLTWFRLHFFLTHDPTRKENSDKP